MALTEGNINEEGRKNTDRMGAVVFCYSVMFRALSQMQLCIQNSSKV
jgi:hypothetical protein